MRPEDNLNKHIELLKQKDPQVSSLIHQLIEYRASIADNQINNQLLRDLISKYSESEIRLKKLNQELTLKQDRLEQDLIAAAEIQKSLLPTNVNFGEILDVAWRFQPCEKIGGDIFNIIQLNHDYWAVYIIDVAGHGVPAAMVAVTVYQYLQPQSGNLVIQPDGSPQNQEIRQPAHVLKFLDREYPFDRFNNFFTMNYVILNIKTGALVSSSAGHPPPIILRKDGTLVMLKKGGRPIGTIDLRLSTDEPIVYEEEREQIGVEDKLLFYTDGVYEYLNDQGEFYGNKRFHEKLKALKGQPVSDLIDASFESLMAFGNNSAPRDDVSLLGIQLKNLGTSH
ncbi:MAG: SpoIIE family protein phosphatase [Desulfobacterales bacterium]|jgi:sigma-B regulation protein RsbU (phosphoserine phosphatase)